MAFIPGYVTQVASGFLFGYPKGALYGVIGMLLGGVIAVGLARLLGRPLVVRMVGEARLNRWEHVARLDSCRFGLSSCWRRSATFPTTSPV